MTGILTFRNCFGAVCSVIAIIFGWEMVHAAIAGSSEYITQYFIIAGTFGGFAFVCFAGLELTKFKLGPSGVDAEFATHAKVTDTIVQRVLDDDEVAEKEAI